MTTRVWELNDEGMRLVGEVNDVEEQVGRLVVTLHPSHHIAQLFFNIPEQPKPAPSYALTHEDGGRRFAVLKSWTLQAGPQLVTAVFVDTEMAAAA